MVLVATGCTEALNGPRIVQREDGRFYIRHAPLTDSNISIGALADDICANRNGSARLRKVIQYHSFDVRSADFRCVPQTSFEPEAEGPPDGSV